MGFYGIIKKSEGAPCIGSTSRGAGGAERGTTMRISINGKNIEVSDYLKDLVTKKVSKLDKYFPEDTEAHVLLAVERNRHIVEVTIPYAGGIIRGEEVSGDMYASIDTVLAKVEKQITRHRTRLEKNLRADAFEGVDFADHEDDEDDDIDVYGDNSDDEDDDDFDDFLDD